jgi:hypothetical protein
MATDVRARPVSTEAEAVIVGGTVIATVDTAVFVAVTVTVGWTVIDTWAKAVRTAVTITVGVTEIATWALLSACPNQPTTAFLAIQIVSNGENGAVIYACAATV